MLRINLLVRALASANVRAALQRCGLTAVEMERGRQLLAEALRLNQKFTRRVRFLPNVDEAIEWARSRFPVIGAVLADVAPAIADHVFDEVDMSNTARTLVSIEVVCGRLLALELGETAEEGAAWKALEEHLVTKDEILHAQSLVADMPRFEGAVEADMQAAIAERESALKAGERFRDKWGRIARTVIHDRSTLQMMGLTSVRRGTVSEEEPVAEEESETTAPSEVTD